MRLRLTSISLLALGLLAAVPAASPAAVTIGSTLAAPATENLGSFCLTAPCTATNAFLPPASTAPGGLASPITGVVVRWSVRSGSNGNPIRLRILRPAAASATFQGVGSSDQALTASTTPPAAAPSFATRLPIRAGDHIGLNAQNGALVFGATDPTTSSVLWGASNGFANGLGDGVTATGAAANDETLVQATVEPDADRDGYGDETQDACPADATRHVAPCPTTPGGTTPPPADTTRPAITSLAVSPTTFRLGASARVRLRVSESARVTLSFSRLLTGRRSASGRCLAPRRGRTGRACTRSIGAGTRTLAAGATSVSSTLGTTIGGRALRAGRYRVRATAIDAAGNVSVARSTTFRVTPRATRGRR